MNMWMKRTTGALGIMLALVLAGCGSGDPVESAASESTEAPTTTTAAAPTTTTAAPTTTTAAPTTTTTIVVADSEPEALALTDSESVEQLALTVGFFGVSDPAGTAQCMIDSAAEIGVAGEDILNDDAAFVNTFVNCDEAAFRAVTSESYATIDTEGRAITSEQLDCVGSELVDFIAASSYEELQVLVATQEMPVEFATAVGEACGLSTEDATFLLDSA